MAWYLIVSLFLFLCCAFGMTILTYQMLGDVIREHSWLHKIINTIPKDDDDRRVLEDRLTAQRDLFRFNFGWFLACFAAASMFWSLIYFGTKFLHPMLSGVYSALRAL